MNRVYLLGGLLAVAVVLSAQAADDKEEKLPSIKKIMKDAHTADDSIRKKISEAIKGKDWDTASSTAKDWVKLAGLLPRIKPKKGDAESWKKHTDTYSKTINTLADAAEAKDAKKANGALGAIGSQCGSCHKAHK